MAMILLNYNYVVVCLLLIEYTNSGTSTLTNNVHSTVKSTKSILWPYWLEHKMRSVTNLNKKITVKITTVTPKRNIGDDPVVRPQKLSKRPNVTPSLTFLSRLDNSDQ